MQLLFSDTSQSHIQYIYTYIHAQPYYTMMCTYRRDVFVISNGLIIFGCHIIKAVNISMACAYQSVRYVVVAGISLTRSRYKNIC